ncbi:hypothetical protein L3Q82_024520 [Scortum barcoo]|uniref:Uncharacterized protein n=1 Tax=Scortum barcoo TaxID=214431 RepID=A0ACB8WPJ9_9TELE|nr:hypothetical protein L3Q82_024520 [Scortum barcoo]
MMLSCWLHQGQDLQCVLGSSLQPKCEAAERRISTSKSEAMVLDRKRVACPLRVGGEVLPQVEESSSISGSCSQGGVPGTSHREEARGRPRTCWRDFVSRLAWEHLEVLPEELEEVSGVKGSLGISAQTAASATWSRISG